MINKYSIIDVIQGTLIVVNVDEAFNGRTGDVDTTIACRFFQAGEEVGYATIKNRGVHQYIDGDPAGQNLATEFGILKL